MWSTQGLWDEDQNVITTTTDMRSRVKLSLKSANDLLRVFQWTPITENISIFHPFPQCRSGFRASQLVPFQKPT